MKLYLGSILICLFCCGLAKRMPPLEANQTTTATSTKTDPPLMIEVKQIGDNYAVFNITGSSTVDGLPVVDLNVQYTIDGQSEEIVVRSLSEYYSDRSQMLQELVKIPGLTPGLKYHFIFTAVNAKKGMGPPSRDVPVLLLPPTPDIAVDHPRINKLVVEWGRNRAKSEDYFLLTVEKKSAIGCGITLNITSCYGNKYSLDDLEVGQTYKLTMRAHNPTGFSDPVVVSYPIE